MNTNVKTAFSLLAFILMLCQASFAKRIEFDYTKETLSNGQLNLNYNYCLVSGWQDNVIVSNALFSDRDHNKDTLVALGAYHNFSKALYLYVNGAYNFSPSVFASNGIETEVGYNIVSPWVLVASYKRRNYPLSFIETYSPGIDYYLTLPAWISARYYVSKANDGTMSYSSLFKLFYDLNDSARAYIGYASGNESYKDLSTAAVFGFNASTTMAGIQVKVVKDLSLKFDVSRESRDNGVTNLSTNYGVSYQW